MESALQSAELSKSALLKALKRERDPRPDLGGRMRFDDSDGTRWWREKPSASVQKKPALLPLAEALRMLRRWNHELCRRCDGEISRIYQDKHLCQDCGREESRMLMRAKARARKHGRPLKMQMPPPVYRAPEQVASFS